MFFFKFYKYISEQIKMKNKKAKNCLSTIKKIWCIFKKIICIVILISLLSSLPYIIYKVLELGLLRTNDKTIVYLVITLVIVVLVSVFCFFLYLDLKPKTLSYFYLKPKTLSYFYRKTKSLSYFYRKTKKVAFFILFILSIFFIFFSTGISLLITTNTSVLGNIGKNPSFELTESFEEERISKKLDRKKDGKIHFKNDVSEILDFKREMKGKTKKQKKNKKKRIKLTNDELDLLFKIYRQEEFHGYLLDSYSFIYIDIFLDILIWVFYYIICYVVTIHCQKNIDHNFLIHLIQYEFNYVFSLIGMTTILGSFIVDHMWFKDYYIMIDVLFFTAFIIGIGPILEIYKHFSELPKKPLPMQKNFSWMDMVRIRCTLFKKTNMKLLKILD